MKIPLVIGKAILLLLEDDNVVSVHTLAQQLKQMPDAETEATRREINN